MLSPLTSLTIAMSVGTLLTIPVPSHGQSLRPVHGATPEATLAPEAILRQSDRMGANFSADDRSFQLFRLAEVGSELGTDSSRELVGKWARALFRSAQQGPKDWNRGAFEKNAAVMLSSADPDEAFRLLKRVDAPDLSSDPPPPEDVRSFGARTIFVDYWKRHGLKALNPIQQAALGFGRTGEYPFPAMANVLAKLGTTDAEIEFRQRTLADAVRCYLEPTRIQSSNQDFMEFLEMRWSSLDRPSRLLALRAAVARLTSPPADEPAKTFASRVTTNKGTASFDSEQMLLLYGIMGKVREVDADWAEKLESDYPAMKQAGGAGAKAEQPSQVTVENRENNASQDAVNSVVAKRLQSGTLARIRAVAGKDLDLAMRLLAQLTEPEFRSEGMAAIATELWAKDPKSADSMLESAMLGASGIPADLQAKARASLSVAQAAAAMKQEALFHAAIATGFTAATESVQEDVDIHPDKPYYLARGMNELSRLMELDMRIFPDDGSGRTARMQDGELKAFLLIDCAEAEIHANHRK